MIPTKIVTARSVAWLAVGDSIGSRLREGSGSKDLASLRLTDKEPCEAYNLRSGRQVLVPLVTRSPEELQHVQQAVTTHDEVERFKWSVTDRQDSPSQQLRVTSQ